MIEEIKHVVSEKKEIEHGEEPYLVTQIVIFRYHEIVGRMFQKPVSRLLLLKLKTSIGTLLKEFTLQVRQKTVSKWI